MNYRLVIITGAPTAASLALDDDSLVHSLDPAIACFLGLPSPPTTETQAAEFPVWRSLVPTDLADEFLYLANPLAGLVGSSTTTDPLSSAQLLSQFLEHSLSFSVDPTPDDHSALQSLSTFHHSESQTDGPCEDQAERAVREPLRVAGASSSLVAIYDIPPAARLEATRPALAVDLIAGVISMEGPREVRTRWGSTVFLVEMVVGDETRAGLGVSFWHSSVAAAAAMLGRLRRQDVLLLHNFGLGVFMGRVFAQSQRRNASRVHLLYRRPLVDGDPLGYYSLADLAAAGPLHTQLGKTRRVRDWIIRFVAATNPTEPNTEQPPEDS